MMQIGTAPKKFSVYFLREPDFGPVRYVGITAFDIKKRFSQHLRESRPYHKSYWVQKLKREGQLPECEVIVQDATFEEAAAIEIAVIAGAKLRGDDLTNMLPGGELGRLGVSNSSGAVAKMLKSREGYKHTEETRRKISVSNLGKRRSLASREKMKEAWKLREPEAGLIEKMKMARGARKGPPMLGKSHSLETRAKISAAKMGQGMGRKHSEATREKMRAAWEKRN